RERPALPTEHCAARHRFGVAADPGGGITAWPPTEIGRKQPRVERVRTSATAWRGHNATIPPSLLRSAAGMDEGASEQRNRIAAATSSASAKRLIGVSFRKAARCSSVTFFWIAVMVVPGDTELIWMLSAAYCTPAWRVSASTAPLEAQ